MKIPESCNGDSLSLTVPPFIKMTLRMTNSRPILELEGSLHTQPDQSPADPKQILRSNRSLQDRRRCLHRLQLVHKYVQVNLGVDFYQFQAKDLERSTVRRSVINKTTG